MAEALTTALVLAALAGCGAGVAMLGAVRRIPSRHRALRELGRERESRALARPLPGEAGLPHVVVQIPCFNEGALVARAVDQAVALDWPRGKLHVQILDDSTDGSERAALAAAQAGQARGVDVSVLHRPTRDEFKGGALRAAMAATPHGYFAVFDVDFVYPPDFLRSCMTPLLADEGLGFVQARVDWLNGDDGALARGQRVIMDFDQMAQAVRYWGDGLLMFNGTGGVWRRAAVEAAGGWRGTTVMEDLDLSCRAWLAGWRGAYLSTVSCRGELPCRLADWMGQGRRWMAGYGEVVRRMLGREARRRAAGRAGVWSPSSPLGFWIGCVTVMGSLAVTGLAAAAAPGLRGVLAVAAVAVIGAFLAAFLTVGRAANLSCRPGTPYPRFLRDFLLVPLLVGYLAWASLASVPATVLGVRRTFLRTPKKGGTEGRGHA